MALSNTALQTLKSNGADVVFIRTTWEKMMTTTPTINAPFDATAKNDLVTQIGDLVTNGMKPVVSLEFNGSYTMPDSTKMYPTSKTWNRTAAAPNNLKVEMWQSFVQRLGGVCRDAGAYGMAVSGGDNIPQPPDGSGSLDIWRWWTKDFGMVLRESKFNGELYFGGYNKGDPTKWQSNGDPWFFDPMPSDRTTYMATHVLDPTETWATPTMADTQRVSQEAKKFSDWCTSNGVRGIVRIKADASWNTQLQSAIARYQYSNVQVVVSGVSKSAVNPKGMALYGTDLANTTVLATTANGLKQNLKALKTFTPPGTLKSPNYPNTYMPNHILLNPVPSNAPAHQYNTGILQQLNLMSDNSGKAQSFNYNNVFAMPVVVFYDDDPDVKDVWVDISAFNAGAASAPGAFTPTPGGEGPVLGGPFRLATRGIASKPWRNTTRDTSITFIRLDRTTGKALDVRAFWQFDWNASDRTKAIASWGGLMKNADASKTLQFGYGSTTASGLDTSQLTISIAEMEALAAGTITHFNHTLVFNTQDSLKGFIFPARQDDGTQTDVTRWCKEGNIIMGTEDDATIDARSEPLMVKAIRKTISRYGVFACDKTSWNIGWQLEPSYQWMLYHPGQSDYNTGGSPLYNTLFGTGGWYQQFDKWNWETQGFKVIDPTWQETTYRGYAGM